MELSNDMKALTEAKIPLDDFAKVMDLAEDFDFEQSEDPVKDFEAAIKMLNEQEALPSFLSEWCIVYGLDHNEMEIEPPDEDFDI